MNLIEIARRQVDGLLRAAYDKSCAAGELSDGLPFSGMVEIPRDTSHGDYAANHAMTSAKQFRLAPRKIAEILTAHLDLSDSYFSSFSIAGPGFINFTLSQKWYGEVLQAVELMGEDYGTVDIGGGKRVMVEFVSANPTGPMTIGNARGGALGDTLASVLSKAGYDVWREFYVNDAGNQVDLFGKSINARYMQLCPGGSDYPFPEDGYHGDDIKALASRIFEIEGDSLKDLPEETRIGRFTAFALPFNIALMKEHLKRYRINFDEWFPESRLHESGYVAETIALLEKSDLIYEKDGAVWLKNILLGSDKDEVMRKANGFYTYYAVDIAYHRHKLERGFDKIIDIWGADHHGHALRMKASMSAPALGGGAGEIAGQARNDEATQGVDEVATDAEDTGASDKIDFLIMQMVRLTRGGETVKVSKRTGKALTLNDLLDEISADACRFFFNARPDSHLEFDLDLAVRQDSENPVYYVQYAHARICSLIAMLASEGHNVPAYQVIDSALLNAESELELIKQIARLPEEIKGAANEYDPSRINKFVIELAARFHRFYNACRIKGEDPAILSARLKLADTTRAVIRICLEIIGVSAPEKM